jgi:hypothetical protein
MGIFEADKSFGLITLPDLAHAYLGDMDEKIGLPGFQRNAVWNEERVEDLWDSILCHFPIGSILLARYQDFSSVGMRNLQLTRSQEYPDTLIGAGGDGYIVVDGQQRLNAISLGYLPFEHSSAARLWIDLAGPQEPTKRQFDFYLCTREHPFGPRLKKEEKRNALKIIAKEGVDDSELSLDMTFPYSARIPLPFVELCQWIRQGEDLDTILHALTSENVHLSGKALEHIRAKISGGRVAGSFLNDLRSAVQEVVYGSDYSVPLILIEKRSAWMTEEKLGKLFERVNINGQVPPQAELFFSALKLRMPEINNYVAEVYNDAVVGRIMKPTDVILAALRMIDPKPTELKLELFGKISQEHHARLLALMERASAEKSIFGQCMLLAYQTLHHTGQAGDIGLPRQYLAGLRPRVWQTILVWIEKNLKQIRAHGINPADRLNMIRYAVLDSLNFLIPWQSNLAAYTAQEWFARFPAEYAAEHISYFPALEIYQKIRERASGNNLSPTFHTPESYSQWLFSGSKLGGLTLNELSNEHCLILYAQRQYLVKWEKYRLDVDHILPSAWMSFRAGPIASTHFWRVENFDHWNRHRVLNWSGNKRYWPDVLNRIYQDVAPHKKFIGSNLELPMDETHQYYGLFTGKDVLAATAMDESLAEMWLALARPNTNEQRIWTTQRFLDFARAVNQRRSWMYRQIYDILQFSEWAAVLGAQPEEN